MLYHCILVPISSEILKIKRIEKLKGQASLRPMIHRLVHHVRRWQLVRAVKKKIYATRFSFSAFNRYLPRVFQVFLLLSPIDHLIAYIGP